MNYMPHATWLWGDPGYIQISSRPQNISFRPEEVHPPSSSRWWPEARAALLQARATYGDTFPALGYARYPTGSLVVPFRNFEEASHWYVNSPPGYHFIVVVLPQSIDHPPFWRSDERF